jgi:uncharacterized protein
MLQLKHPGVYTQEIPSGVRTISGAPTSVALFVGPTRTGIDARPIRIQNFGDFERNFGGLSQTSNLSYSVLHFFANGGGEAFVVRVPAAGATAAKSIIKRDISGSAASITLTALGSGSAGNEIFVEIDSFDIDGKPFSTVDTEKRLFNLTISDRLSGRVERFSKLSTSSTSARVADQVVSDIGTGSRLVGLVVNGFDAERPVTTGTTYELAAIAAPGTFSAAINTNIVIAVRDAAGTVDNAQSVTLVDVPVFANGATKPISVIEVAAKLESAINLAIRSDPAIALAMQGVTVSATLAERGKYLRLRTSAPGPDTVARRLFDATVTLVNPATGTSFTSICVTGTAKGVNVSRYRLGAPYTPSSSEQIQSAVVPGSDGSSTGQPDSTAFKAAVLALEGPDAFFNLLCLPDIVRPSAGDPKALQHSNAMSVYGEAARICKKKHAFLLVDPLPNVVDVGSAESFKVSGITFQSSHAAAYFPNIRVDDPLEAGAIRAHPPSGAIAGVIARTDGQFGVWQAPAGTEAALSGVYGPSVVLSDDDHGVLNPIGLNCIRSFPIFGTVSFGARTIDGANALASEWRYVPVRRTASYILRSLSEGLRWAVHKPNGEQLWSQMRLNTTAFMHGMFRQGAFKGVSAREAYFVQCDASTTTGDDINQGIVNIIVGFAPLKPAEFVVISLRQIVQPLI